MSRLISITAILWCAASFIFGKAVFSDDLPQSIPDQVNGFELPALDGKTVSLASNGSPTIVLFLGTECPLAKLYSPLVQKIVAEQSSEVRVIGVSSNRQDSLDDLRKFVKQHDIRFEVAKDYQNRIADRFGAKRTPEVFLLDPELRVVYHGRVDDQYSPGITRAKARQNFLQDALKQMLSGQPVTLARTEPVGCLIGKVRQPVQNSKITYTKQISRMLQSHCIECHRAGEIGPFALTEYDEVVGWAEMMQEVMEQKRMPPWHADPQHGDFVNARLMTQKEKSVFSQWIENGMPYGEQSELPPSKKFNTGWDVRHQPEQIIKMSTQPFEVPANGVVEYQYFVVDPGFKKDRWIKSAQVLPGNRSVVHHSIVFVRPPDGRAFRGIGWLSAYVPGQRTFVLPEGHARLIPAGSKLVFQQHYTPSGSVQQDVTSVGLTFAEPGEIQQEVYTVAGLNQDFEIPPLIANHEVETTVGRLPRKGQLLSLTPHMHLRGKSFQVISRQQDRKTILCSVPDYDFNWQHTYVFRKPLALADIGTLGFTATFDNSPDNPFNPDPNQRVTWGDQTFEEMAVAFFDVAVPRNKLDQKKKRDMTANAKATQSSEKVVQFVDRFFQRWDQNGDDIVERSEVPVALRGFGFFQYDINRDSRLSRKEVTQAARRRLDGSDPARSRQ